MPALDRAPEPAPQTPLPAAGAFVLASGPIGYVAMERALAQTDEGRHAKAFLKNQFDEKQQQLDALQTSLERDQSRLEHAARDGSVSDAEARRQRAELERKLAEATKTWKEAQAELSTEEKRLTREISSELAVVVRELATDAGFLLVFDQDRAGLLFAPGSADLTDEVIRRYDARHPVPGVR
ncbi:MAG: OmpH family outer membrane protein [Deltaproteobacteria bacterium]|nr:OmpH family outer membrane protein [Deltaproteobacteria bacterium]